jgi:uncharacterized protein (DUF2062 family)
MINRFKTRILKFTKLLLQKGMSLRKISLSIALGAALGIFPVLGATTLLCTIAAFGFRLNFPAIQAVNYAVYPLQLILLVPFYNAGSWLFSGQSIPLIQENIIEVLKNDFWGSMADLWDLTLYAVFAWLIISPFFILICYGLLKPVIHRLVFSGAMTHSGVKTSSKQPFGNDKA